MKKVICLIEDLNSGGAERQLGCAAQRGWLRRGSMDLLPGRFLPSNFVGSRCEIPIYSRCPKQSNANSGIV